MKLLLTIAFAACAFAQTAAPVLTLGPPVKGEYSASIDVKLSGASTSNVAALQFTPSAPVAPVTLSVTIGPAAVAAGKTLACKPGGGRCILYGINANAISDGVVATITLTSTSSASLSEAIDDLLAASLTADGVAVTTPGPVAVTLASPCDLNGDGKTDLLDVQGAIVQATGGAACASADLTGRGKCDILDVQRVVNAAAGGACKSGL